MAVLYIDLSSSMCGACKGNADPNENAHLNKNMRGDGCGDTYTVVSSHYAGPGLAERVQAMRPDLPFVEAPDADL